MSTPTQLFVPPIKKGLLSPAPCYWARSAIGTVLLALLACFASAQTRSVSSLMPERSGGVYKTNELIRWIVPQDTLKVLDDNAEFSIRRDGLTPAAQGRLDESGATNIHCTLTEPGTVMLEIKAQDKALRVLGGAVVQPNDIRPALPPPKDFDDFWDGKLRELQQIPPSPSLTACEAQTPGISYWHIRMNNIGGTHIQGQLARKEGSAKLPAMLIVQWAGVYPLQKNWVLQPAAEGWLVLNINAHDLPIDESAEFYQKQAEGPLKNYASIGNEDRDTSYFLRMYLSCYRAAQYLVERPDWDGKTLLVTGNSQGGLQALMTAALHRKVTAVIAGVPAGCDLNGPVAGRSPGWPMWWWNVGDKDPQKVRSASRYYDVVNFARHISCPILVGIGLIDETCPPAGILAAVNQSSGKQDIVFLPHGAHQEINDSHRAFSLRSAAWKSSLLKGQPPAGF